MAFRFAAFAISIVMAAMSPLPNLALLPLEQRHARPELEDGRPVAGIIVLGGSEDADVANARRAHALNEAGERLTEAVALSRRFPGARIVFTGGSGSLFGGPSEASAVQRTFADLGLAPDRLTLEDKSRDTFENATFTRALVTPRPGERWLLLTSAFHMPRSYAVFWKAGFAVEPYPVDFRTRGWEDATSPMASPIEGLRRLDFVVREYVGLVAYWLAGRIERPF